MRFPRFLPLLMLGAALLGPSAHAMTPGDVNNDGNFNVQDAILALRIAAKVDTPTDDQKRAADVAPVTAEGVYGDGNVNVGDATRLLRRAAGLEPAATYPGSRYYNEQTGPTGALPLGQLATVSVHADTTKDFALSGAFKLSGKVTGVTSNQQPSISFYSATSFVGASATVADDGTYAVGLPAGAYVASLGYNIDTTDALGLTTTTEVHAPISPNVTLAGDTTQDYVAPAPPTLFPVHGSLTLPAGFTIPATLDFTMTKDAAGNPPFLNNGANSSGQSYDGTYSVNLPAGTYEVEVSVFSMSGSATLPVNETVTVTGDTTHNVVAQSVFTVSGAALPGPGATFGAFGASIGADTADYKGGDQKFNSGSGQIKNNHYELKVPGDTYKMTMRWFQIKTNSNESWSYDLGKLVVNADMTKDYQGPAAPEARVNLIGTVTGPDGKPVTKGGVFASSTALDGATAGLSFTTSGQLSSTGAYSLSVPPGEYRLYVIPNNDIPTAFPSAIPPGG